MSLFGADLAPALAEARRSIEMLSETVRLQREQITNERERYDALLEKCTALRVAGAVPEPVLLATPTALAKLELREPDELKALIHEKSGDNLRIRRMMLRQLTIDRAAGLSPEKIRAAIELGVQSDGVPV